MPKYQTYGQYDARKDEFPESAEKVLRAGEEAASGDFGKDAVSSEKLEKDEQQGFYNSTAREANKREGLYQGSGLATALNGARGRSKGGSFMKRRAPLIAIIALIGGMAVGIGFSQVLMPFHVIESLTEVTDGAFTARAARMPSLAKWIFNMETQDVFTESTPRIKSLLTGEHYRFRSNIESNKVKARLADEGIDVDTSSGKTVLNYHQADGSVRTVTADDYAELWRSDADFRNKMNRGGRSFLGRIAAHIDLTLANFLSSHNLTKNLFKGWINKVYEAEGQTARLHSVIEERKSSTLGDVDAGTGKSNIDEDDKIGSIQQIGDEEGPKKINPKTDTDADLKGKYTDMIANVASITTSAVCGAAAVASAVTAAKLVIAYSNARGTFSAQAEGVDKVKAGMGNTSPINAIADEMMAKDENGKTMLQSEQMKWAISGGAYTPNKNAEDVVSNSQDAMLRGTGGIFDGLSGFWNNLGTIGSSTKWIIGCAAANVATATISIIANIATAGMFSFGKFALTAVAGIGLSVGVSKLASMLVENAKSDFCLDKTGVARGACVYLGASNYNGLNFQNGGGTLATREKAEAFYDSYKIALADEAELIRSEKSPFDASSSHTFLGSIISKFSVLAVDMPDTANMLSNLANVTMSSFNSLLPSASALEKTSFLDNQLRDDCENLNFGSFQALGDTNCEAWYITDQSMNDSNPEETFNYLMNYHLAHIGVESMFEMNADGSLKTDEKTGAEIINPKSDLAKYISYCAYRNSPFGHVDQNIMDAETSLIKTGNETANSTINQILGVIPIVGDFIQAVQGVSQIATLGWSTGANCVARGTAVDTQIDGMTVDDVSQGPQTAGAVSLTSWNEFMKYAQSYVADDRYMETVDKDYVSPVQEYMKGYGGMTSDDELSFVEYLAKYSGYTVENMQIALNEIEYWAYIGQYDPEGRGPMQFSEAQEPVYDFTSPEVVPSEILAILPQRVMYFAREQWTTA
ncbi:hypothetical protein IJN73_01805 [Candidatus Saccharibacteria bacterium]|nr:hypothetical protein [Candidatus Saccharibacteria bacterium]MBQ7040782.1 hypothetical protein [Candidatus Saccharibacteria bacterium]